MEVCARAAVSDSDKYYLRLRRARDMGMGIGGPFFAGWRVVYPSGDKWDGAFPVADTGPPSPLPPSPKRQHAITPRSRIIIIPNSYILMQTSAMSFPNMDGAKF